MIVILVHRMSPITFVIRNALIATKKNILIFGNKLIITELLFFGMIKGKHFLFRHFKYKRYAYGIE